MFVEVVVECGEMAGRLAKMAGSEFDQQWINKVYGVGALIIGSSSASSLSRVGGWVGPVELFACIM